jgi:hypothetical protein
MTKRKKIARRKYDPVPVASVSPAAWIWAANIVKHLWPKLTVSVPTAARAPSGVAERVFTPAPYTRAPRA